MVTYAKKLKNWLEVIRFGVRPRARSSFAFHIPLLWRYIFAQYGKILALTLFGFLLILLSTKLEEAARLTNTGASAGAIALFILYQIPYVLQIALPISTLIASLYLFQRLSHNSELTAVRASGISLFELVTPIIILSTFLALFSFQTIFDISVRSHLATKKLEYHLRETEPLTAMHNARLLEKQGISLEMKGSLLLDKHASDMIMAVKNSNQGNCSIVIMKKVASFDKELSGHLFSLINTKPSSQPEEYDELLIENALENKTPVHGLSFFTNKKKEWKAGNDLLPLSLLLAKKENLQQKIVTNNLVGKKSKRSKKHLNRVYTELGRRVSASFAIISFTLLGVAYGCTVGRQQSKKRFINVIALAAFFLITFLAAKGIPEKVVIASLLYTVPHVLIIFTSVNRLKRLQKGIEG